MHPLGVVAGARNEVGTRTLWSVALSPRVTFLAGGQATKQSRYIEVVEHRLYAGRR